MDQDRIKRTVHELAGLVDFHVPGHDRAQFGQVTGDECAQVPAYYLGIFLSPLPGMAML
jgi:hypothetical protein